MNPACRKKTLSFAFRFLILTLAYYLASKLGCVLAFFAPPTTVVWPAVGVGLAGMMLWGYGVAPAIFLGSILANYQLGSYWQTPLLVSLGNFLQSFTGYFLIRSFGFGNECFQTPRGVFRFFAFAGVFSSLLGSSIGSYAFLKGPSFLKIQTPWMFALAWWLGNISGALIITPLILFWSRANQFHWKKNQRLEAVFLAFSFLVSAWIVFWPSSPLAQKHYPIAFLFIPLMIWVAYRFGPRETVSLFFILSALAVYSTLFHTGPFVQDTQDESLILLQIFLVVMALMTLSISASSSEWRRIEKALRQSHERYQSLVLASAQVVWTASPEGNVVEDLPSWRGFTGQSLKEILGRGWMSVLHPEDLEKTALVWENSLRTQSAHENEFRVRRSDGSYAHVYARAVPVFEHEGHIREWVGTCTDITKRKEQEKLLQQKTEELAKSNRELEQLSSLKSEFVTIVTHELRTPLAVILEGINLILEGVDGPVTLSQKETLNVVKRNIDRLGRMVNNVLDFQRLSSGIGELHFEENDLKTIVDEVCEGMRLEMEKKQILLEVKSTATNMRAVCDSDRVKQVLMNLIENAFKFTEKKGTISVEVESEGDEVSLCVRDTGKGIPQEDQKKIFEMFSQSGSQGWKAGGFGVGLTVCRKIAEAHAGKILLESKEGVGSCFKFVFPRRRNLSVVS